MWSGSGRHSQSQRPTFKSLLFFFKIRCWVYWPLLSQEDFTIDFTLCRRLRNQCNTIQHNTTTASQSQSLWKSRKATWTLSSHFFFNYYLLFIFYLLLFLSVFVCLVLVCRVVVWAVQSVKSGWALSQCRDLRVEPQIPSLPPSHAGRLLCWRFFWGIVYCYCSSGRESPLTFPLTLHEISINLKTICFPEKYFQCSLQTFVSSMCVYFLTVVGKCEIIFRNSTESKGYLWRNIYSLMKLMIKAH